MDGDRDAVIWHELRRLAILIAELAARTQELEERSHTHGEED